MGGDILSFLFQGRNLIITYFKRSFKTANHHFPNGINVFKALKALMLMLMLNDGINVKTK